MKCFTTNPKIILVPYPAQGHVTPMLMLASAFRRRGFLPILITPTHIHRQISPHLHSNHIRCLSIPDGLDDAAPRDFFAVETAMETVMPAHLRAILAELGGVACMVVDLLASWAIEVGRECGVAVAGFWPAMFESFQLIAAIPEMVRNGLISETGSPQQPASIQCHPNHPLLSPHELPWLIGPPAARTTRFKFWTRTLARTTSLQHLLVNSFPQHHSPKTVSPTRVFHIGPLLHHSPLPKPPTLWEEDRTCLQWLDKHPPGSVLYIAFGSWVTPINDRKLQSLATALSTLGKPFIWVLKNEWREGLPVGFAEGVSSRGKVVSWAPQMEILKHRAVGCYLTHCGWNSVMEAVVCGKRMVCYPVAGDQFVNCGYVVEVWGVGVRLQGFGEKEVGEGVRKVMEDGEMGKRMRKVRERMVGEGASSRVRASFTAFVNEVKMLQPKAQRGWVESKLGI